MNLFILAAGLGTRFKPLTLKMPKPAIPFLNVPMGYYNFRFLKSLNSSIEKFVVNTHHLPDQIKDLYTAQKFISAPVGFSNEIETILGTAGGIKFAEPMFKKYEPILMMNADEIIFTKNDDFLVDALAQHKATNSLATLIVTKNREVGKKFGAILCKGNSVKIISKTIDDTTLEPWHYIGIMILSWEIVSLIDKYTEQNIFYDILVNHLQRVQIFPIEADWFETGNQADFLKATQQALHQMQKKPINEKYKNVLEFINQVDPSTLLKTESTTSIIAKNIKLNTKKMLGFNAIRSDAKISSSLEIKNAVIFADENLT